MTAVREEREQVLDDLTIGAPKSARETLRSGAISIETLRLLCEVDDWRGAVDLVVTMASILSVPVLYALLPNPLTAVFCVLLAIRNFNCAAQLVHESDHGTLLRHPTLNKMMGNLCSYMLGYTRSGHRQAHMDHHLYLNTARDPDIILSQPEESGRKLLANLLQDLVFVLAVKRFLQYFQSDPSNYSVLPWRTLSVAYFTRMLKPIGLVILAQAGLFLVFAMTAGPTFYLWFHVLPIMTLYPFQIRVRSIAEHSFEPGYAPRLSDDIWVARTSRLNMFERIIVAPFGQRYHYEHHVFPGVPNCNLAKVHRLLIDAGIPVPVNTSYFGFVTRKILMDLSGTAK